MINNLKEAEKIETAHRRKEREERRMAKRADSTHAPASKSVPGKKNATSSKRKKSAPKKLSKNSRVVHDSNSDDEMTFFAGGSNTGRVPVD